MVREIKITDTELHFLFGWAEKFLDSYEQNCVTEGGRSMAALTKEALRGTAARLEMQHLDMSSLLNEKMLIDRSIDGEPTIASLPKERLVSDLRERLSWMATEGLGVESL